MMRPIRDSSIDSKYGGYAVAEKLKRYAYNCALNCHLKALDTTMFETLPLLPADPILGLSIAYAKDTNPLKVDLGVGVYKNDSGVTPIMAAVTEAEKLRIKQETTRLTRRQRDILALMKLSPN